METEFEGRTALLAGALLLLAGAAACGGEGPRGGRPPADSAPRAADATPLPPARYLTLVAWTAPPGRPAGVLWLENRADSAEGLGRRYRGWSLTDRRTRRVLSVDDRLPVRAAAWRPLPAPSLRLSVDTRGRISEVRLADGDLRLRTGEELASWRGPRGQRQRLSTGRVRAAGDTAATEVAVVLLRFEHLTGEPGRLGPSRTLLLAGEGQGGILLLDESPSRPWSRAWRWNAGGRVRRLESAMLPDSAPPGGPWRIAVPGVGRAPAAEWHVAAGGPGPRRPSPGFRLLPASAAIGAIGGPTRARGFLLRSAARGSGGGRSRGDPGR